MATARIGNIAMAYEVAGDGPNALLLVHGHPFNRSMWRPQLDALGGPTWRVIAPDLRGYGGTTVVPGTARFDDFAEDLAALLDHLDGPRVVIGGLSMGGQIAMHFCRRFPERVRGLLLAATSPQPEDAEGKARRNAMADRLIREGMEPYATDVLPKMLAPRSLASLPAVAAAVLAMMRSTDPAGAAAALRGRADRPAYEPTLAGLSVPALVVGGSADPFTTQHDADRMCDLLRHSELLWLEGVGHMPNLEAETAFNQGVAGLLERVDEQLSGRGHRTRLGR